MVIIVPNTEKFFFPHRKILKLFKENYSPDLMKKIIYAGINSTSFEEAHKNLKVLGEISISQSHIQRITIRIGKEFTLQEEKETNLWEDLPIKNNRKIEVASVSIDGGRAQIRDEDCGVGVHNPAWLETKISCLQILQSKQTNKDPHSMLPKVFKDKKLVTHLVDGLKGYSTNKTKEQQNSKKPNEISLEHLSSTKKQERYGPKVLKRFSFATIDKADNFGNAVLNRVNRQQLHTASRKAYIGDGDRKIWTIYEDYFKHGGWIAILDFVHAVEYVFEAAKLSAGESDLLCWTKYIEWLTHIWQGRILTVIRRLDKIIKNISSDKKNKKLFAKKIERLQKIRNYFKNNYTRMNYPEYRKKGLPISSSHVESLIKQFNKRVKSSEKFWNKTSLKGVLKLKASFISDDNLIESFWNTRYERQVNSKRRYTKHVV